MSKRDSGAVEIIMDIAMESPLASLGIAAALSGVASYFQWFHHENGPLHVRVVAIFCWVLAAVAALGAALGFIKHGFLRLWRARQRVATRSSAGSTLGSTAPAEPLCPSCGVRMVPRTAKRGANAGSRFWGCRNYPRCREIVNIAAAE